MFLMGIFNYIDTFFFISLGITFILILLLVFHFKQRISELESKSETMFEIINNIVKELSSVKQECCLKNTLYQCAPRSETPIPIDFCCLPTISGQNRHEKVLVSDESDDDDSTEYGSESEADSDDESVPPINILGNESVKIISVDIGDTIEVVESELMNDINEEETPEEITDFSEPSELHVEKLEVELNNDAPPASEPQVETSKEIYRKMTLQALKALVITKGLASDPSKMKKPELLKLLETGDD